MTAKKQPKHLTPVPGFEDEGMVVEEAVKEPTRLDRLEESLLTGRQVFDLPPVSWLVPQWIPRHGVTEIFGAPGSGKSFFALRIGLELAMGGAVLSHRFPAPERVLYLAPEGQSEHRDRLEAWEKDSGRKVPTTFHFLPVRVNIFTDEDTSALSQLVRKHGPFGLIVIDTLAASTSGMKENAVEDMTIVTENLDKIRVAAGEACPVMIVHHTGKDATKGGRGSSALEGFVRSTISWTEVTGGHRKAKSGKNNNAPKENLEAFYKIESVELPPAPDDPNRYPRQVGVLRPSDYFTASNDGAADLLRRYSGELGAGIEFSRRDLELFSASLGVSCSKATATRYINAGVASGLLEKVKEGRDATYRFVGSDGFTVVPTLPEMAE